MKRKHKSYSKPKRPFDKTRIDEEAVIKKEFGLKNKREIWKADAKVRSMRQKAKGLITASAEEQQALFERLGRIGIQVESIADVLGLDKTDYLNRRLQTIVFKLGLATTVKTARQMITHKRVLVDGRVVDIPSYIVPTTLEDKITIKKVDKKQKTEEVKEGATPEEEALEKQDE